jgi:hypothetical protein
MGHVDGDACTIKSGDDGICDAGVCTRARCGDGYRRGDEACDGTDLPDVTCAKLGYYSDAVKPTCNSACSLDEAVCREMAGWCGNGTVEMPNEICEPTVAPTQSCVDYGYGAGVLGCQSCGPGVDSCVSFTWTLDDLISGVFDIHGHADNDVYATLNGNDGLMHFDGTKWTTIDLSSCNAGASLYLGSVWSPAPGVVFAAEPYGNRVIRVAGTTCTLWTFGTDQTVNAVYASSTNDAWVSVDPDGLYHFDGTAWTRKLALTTTSNVKDLWGSAANQVFALSHDMSVRRYDGSNWQSVPTPPTLFQAEAIWGTSPTAVYVGGTDAQSRATVERYNGSNWSISLQGHPMLAAVMSTVWHGWSTASGRVYVSATTLSPDHAFVLVNDGSGWTNLRAPTDTAPPVWAPDSGQLFAGAGTLARMAHMTGSIRFDHFPGVSGVTHRLAAAGADEVYDVVTGGELQRWDGNAWQRQQYSSTNIAARDVDASPDGTVYAIGPDGLYATTGGGTWTLASGAVSGDRVAALRDDDVLAVVGAGTMQRWNSTTGTTSTNYDATVTLDDVWGVATASTTIAFAAGGRDGNTPTILHWDGGASWVEKAVPAGVSGTLSRLWGRTATDVYAVSSNADLIHWDGTAWSQINVVAIGGVNGVFGSPNDLFAASFKGVFHFDGTQWSPVATGTPFAIEALVGIGDSLFFVDRAGTSHQLVRSTPW